MDSLITEHPSMSSWNYSTMDEQLPETMDLNQDFQERPFHSKRPHKKSRAGCKNCKTRKVKCDEARPVCRSCRLRKAECVYPSLASTPPGTSNIKTSTAHHVTPSLRPTNSALVPISFPAFPLSPSVSDSGSAFSSLIATEDQVKICDDEAGLFNVIKEPLFRPSGFVDEMDMKLLWFYTCTTSTSFSADGKLNRPAEDIMKSTLVKMGFENRFLMDTLLALASSHMRAIHQDIDPKRAMFYRVRAFQGYRRAVEEADPETFPSLLSNSLLLTALSSEGFREPDAKELYILDWLTIWQGIGLMMSRITIPGMFRAGIDPLFHRPKFDLEAAAAAIPNYLLFMVSSIPVDDPDYPNVQMYHWILRFLGTLYHNLALDFGPIMRLRIISWYSFLPCGFMELARERRPRALIIIAHHTCFLKMVHGVWWIEGIGHRSVKDICDYLDEEWHVPLKVPLLVVDTDDYVEIGRLLLNDPSWVPTSGSTVDPWGISQKGKEKAIGWVDDAGNAVDPDCLLQK